MLPLGGGGRASRSPSELLPPLSPSRVCCISIRFSVSARPGIQSARGLVRCICVARSQPLVVTDGVRAQVDALEITTTITNETTVEARQTDVLHVFFQMDDGSSIAFFAEPSEPFDFAAQRDFDLHLALEVPVGKLHEMFEKGKAAGIETRGISDHGFIESIYFRDPNGYVIELTTPTTDAPGQTVEERMAAREKLDRFQAKHGGTQAML